MKFAAVYRDKLNAPPFSDAPMDALGIWLRLATAAAASESDTIAISEGSSSRTIMLITGLMKAEIDKAITAGLCRWTEKGLFVEGYDYHGQRVFESKRRAGKRGGISKASKHSSSVATAQLEAQLEHSSSPSLSFPLLTGEEDQIPGLSEDRKAPGLQLVPRTPNGRGSDLVSGSGRFSQAFEAFWLVFPGRRKKSKSNAWRIWKRRRCDTVAPQIMAALAWQVKSRDWTKDDGEYCPGPEPYLNQEQWTADPPAGTRLAADGSRPMTTSERMFARAAATSPFTE
jgi:hypothetical protein